MTLVAVTRCRIVVVTGIRNRGCCWPQQRSSCIAGTASTLLYRIVEGTNIARPHLPLFIDVTTGTGTTGTRMDGSRVARVTHAEPSIELLKYRYDDVDYDVFAKLMIYY
jgi:hypothetical protein